MTITPTASRAQAIIAARAVPTGGNSKKSIYTLANGRALALDLQRHFIGLFAELFPGADVLPGVVLRTNARTPGHYGPRDARGASIKSHERLGLGNEIFYVECKDEPALERFLGWYEAA